jgi:hypothetical protein
MEEGNSMSLYQELFMDVAAALPPLGAHHGQGDLLGRWDQKQPWNVPGPLYTGEVDNSGPGPYEAPNNIFVDAEGFPLIFRQPVNLFEVRQVLLAANHDPFRSYGADGNDHWDLTSIRAWWHGREVIDTSIAARQAEELASGHIVPEYLTALDRWREYLQHETELYLRVYAFFLEEGRVPGTEDTLPNL